eukprot:Gb_30159 [translate_table: standard]
MYPDYLHRKGKKSPKDFLADPSHLIRIIDMALDSDGKVTPEEVAAAAFYLKDTLGQEPVQKLISGLAKDKDGKILVEDIVKLGTRVDDVDTRNEAHVQQERQLHQ